MTESGYRDALANLVAEASRVSAAAGQAIVNPATGRAAPESGT